MLTLNNRLDPRVASSQVQTLLETLVQITKSRPQSVQPALGRLYRVLGRYCHSLGPTSALLSHIRDAVGAPLSVTNAPGMCCPFYLLEMRGVDVFD
jgi:ubiquitin-protein ligase E3 C